MNITKLNGFLSVKNVVVEMCKFCAISSILFLQTLKSGSDPVYFLMLYTLIKEINSCLKIIHRNVPKCCYKFIYPYT